MAYGRSTLALREPKPRATEDLDLARWFETHMTRCIFRAPVCTLHHRGRGHSSNGQTGPGEDAETNITAYLCHNARFEPVQGNITLICAPWCARSLNP